jgi:hypothetical protein
MSHFRVQVMYSEDENRCTISAAILSPNGVVRSEWVGKDQEVSEVLFTALGLDVARAAFPRLWD